MLRQIVSYVDMFGVSETYGVDVYRGVPDELLAPAARQTEL
jgi:hypothetical protein